MLSPSRTKKPSLKASQQEASRRQKPRHCRQCPNQPPLLRSRCAHTKAGRAYLKSLMSDLPPSSPPPPNSPMLPATSPAMPSSPSPQTFSGPIDDLMLSGGLPNVVEPETPLPRDTERPIATSGGVVTESPQSTTERTRASAKNPIFGFTEGAKQGNAKYSVFRTTPLRPPQLNSTLAGKRFHRGMRELIVRAENISRETGCWFYMGGQHVNGTQGFTNYASPRLRRDAKPELKAIQMSFQKMTTALVTARRVDAKDLALRLDDVTAAQKKAEDSANAALSALEIAQNESNAKDALIARLSAIVAAGSPHK